MDVFVLNIIFSCRKMVKIRVDLMNKLQQFPLLPYRWSKNPLRRNGNKYLTWISQLRRNGNKPLISGGHWRALNQVNRLYMKRPGVQSRDKTVRSENFLFKAKTCYNWYPDGDGGQCGGGAPRMLCAVANTYTLYYRDDTDRRVGGCRMRWGIQF